MTVARSSSGPDFTYTATSGGQTLASGQATSIESLNINDSRFDDVLNGGDGDEYFSLTRGHDVVSGGAGYDSAYISFIGTTTGVDFVAQTSGINALTYTATSGGGVIASGALTSIERLSVDGSNYNDIIRLPVTGSVYAGAGDDIVYISSINNVFLSGGLGDDTLALEGSGLEIDLTPRIFAAYSIERLDLTGSGDNNLILNDQNVIDATDNRDSAFTAAPINDALVVLGDAGDVLDLRTSSPGGAWAEVQSGVGLDGAAGGGFDFWAYTADGAVTAFLAVDSDVTVTTDGNAAADAFVSALQAQEAAKDDAPLELTQDLLLPAFFDVDEPVAPYSPLHGDFAQPHIA
ncbi:hypothetical protein E6W36_04815 [Hankyongella ginsenosidimutans]|uniref:Calcium-binding protein n=1 Tax=Hankyongella ginsenosidimutans TaxID=1763828 RepID=A0A4D7C7E8_9SPHN|nr:hypothetical protein [Hankyongella ginsenosidimutans]QCI79128.1 hypothetical protein E6W36_04815 [Hankyongella ginsenosidimutans]